MVTSIGVALVWVASCPVHAATSFDQLSAVSITARQNLADRTVLINSG